MIELSLLSYKRVIPLVHASGMRSHLALVYEILDGRLPGRVFVDSPDGLRTAIVANANGFYFGFGRAVEGRLRPMIDQFWQENLAVDKTSLFGSHAEWNAPLARLCAPLGAKPVARLGFELSDQTLANPLSQGALPEGMTLSPITTRLAEGIFDGSLTGGYGLDPWFIRIAGGPQDYAALGLGKVIMAGEQIVSMAGVAGMGGGEVEIEAGTAEAYRGRGLSLIACAAFMAECQAKGLRPTYTCDSANAASIALAHKLGFKEIEEIHGFEMFKQD